MYLEGKWNPWVIFLSVGIFANVKGPTQKKQQSFKLKISLQVSQILGTKKKQEPCVFFLN